MGTIADKFAEAWRDYNTDGVPASGPYDPEKSIIRALGPVIEQSLGATSLGSVDVVKTTLSLLNADLVHDADTTALVYADPTGTNNDLYIKVGASGTGSWTNTGILHAVSAAAASSAADAADSADEAEAARDAVRPLFGTAAPTTEGVDGQIYYRISAGVVTFYGPKAAGVWPAGVTLNGPQGVPGDPGAAATVAVSSTTTLAPGSSATVTNIGTSSAAQFVFGIPRGDVGVGTTTISGLVQSPVSALPVLFAITDSNNRSAFTIYSDGTVGLVLNSASSARVLSAGGISAASGLNQLAAENIGGSFANGLAFMQATIDTNSRAVSGYLTDGTFYIGKYDSRLLAAVTAAEGPALSRNGPFYSVVGGQIVAYFGGAYTALTTEGTNSEPRPLGDRVAFLSTRRRGVTAPYIMNADGSNQRAMLQQAVYEAYPAAGQSNTPGYISTPALTLTAPYPGKALMYAGGAGPIAEYPAVFGGSGTLTDLHEDTSGAFKGESVASSMMGALLDHELTNRPTLKVVGMGNGYPGAAYTAIMKGTGPYNDIIAQAGRLKALGDAEIVAGRGGQATKGAIVRAQILMHGEADWNNVSYDVNLATLQSDFETDVRAATGQVEPVPLVITQMAALRFLAAAPDASGTVKSPLLQLAASIANPKIFLAGPTYWLPTIDYAHWVNTSKRLAGELFEKVIRKVVHEGRDWVPLSPKPFGQWTVGTNTILIPMNVPIGPLAFDTTLVSDPGNKGFSYVDGSGRTITNVQITGANSDQILITLSGAIGANAMLDYAYTNGVNAPNPGITATGSITGTALALSAGGTPFVGMPVSGAAVIGGTYLVSGSGTSWVVNNSQTITSRTLTFNAAGPFAGARGCLRDSDPALSRWDGTTHLYNWCVIFRQALN